MKAWPLPAVALSLLLVSAPALAAVSNQNTATQQERKKAKRIQQDAAGKRNVTSNANRNVFVGHPARVNHHVSNRRVFTPKKTVVVGRTVIVRRPTVANRNVRVNIDLRIYRRNFHSPRRYHLERLSPAVGLVQSPLGLRAASAASVVRAQLLDFKFHDVRPDVAARRLRLGARG